MCSQRRYKASNILDKLIDINCTQFQGTVQVSRELRREMKLILEVNCLVQEPDWLREASLVALSERAQYEEHEATPREKLT